MSQPKKEKTGQNCGLLYKKSPALRTQSSYKLQIHYALTIDLKNLHGI